MSNHRTDSTEIDFADLREEIARSGALSSSAVAPPPPPAPSDRNQLVAACPECREVIVFDHVVIARLDSKETAKGDGWVTKTVHLTALAAASHVHNERVDHGR